MPDLLLLLLAFVVGGALTTALVPPLAWLCHRRGWLDRPGPRKLHSRPTPRLTGITLFGSIWITVTVWVVLIGSLPHEFAEHAVPVVIGAFTILALGVIDDLRPLSGNIKLAVQIGVGSFLFVTGVGFDRLWIPFVGGINLGFLAGPVTLLWFLVLVNAVNIIDGMDGLAVSTTAVATIPLIWIAWTMQLTTIGVGAAGLLGGLVGFWRYNKPPARVFMGDSGSLSLGYFFAVIALLAPVKRFTALAFFVPIIALFVPLAESVLSFGRRWLSGVNPIGADSDHLHHRLVQAGWSQKRILVAYNVLAGIFGAFCVGYRYLNRRLLTVVLGIFVLLLAWGLGMILHSQVGSVDPRDSQGA